MVRSPESPEGRLDSESKHLCAQTVVASRQKYKAHKGYYVPNARDDKVLRVCISLARKLPDGLPCLSDKTLMFEPTADPAQRLQKGVKEQGENISLQVDK